MLTHNIDLNPLKKTLGLTALGALATRFILPTASSSSCRQVDVNTRLNVRSQPGGEIIGTLEDGQDISIRNRGGNGWVPVFAPIEGYVAANFLEYCP